MPKIVVPYRNTAQTILTQKKGGGAAKKVAGVLHTLFVGRLSMKGK